MVTTRALKASEALGPLNEVEDRYAPDTLYLRGDPTLLQGAPRVSIVGSRDASEEGMRRARKLAQLLAKETVTVVSGLAKGVDAAAHLGAMEAGGNTIAVLGTPLNRVYPREHAELQATIGRDHLLVSQFPEGHPITKKNFPRRNRVMALISHATVIVEAREGSGCLSQAWEAVRLGRPLFLMRSTLEIEGLSWPEGLLDYGAYVLDDIESLLPVLPGTGTPAEALAF
jgi:DNA processing protein